MNTARILARAATVRRASHAALGALILASAAAPLAAQRGPARGATAPTAPPKPLDRTAIPTPAKDPALHLPTWTRVTLANGTQLVVSERHGLPLVSFTVNFLGGANQFEPADKVGTAAFVAGMLGEGTTSRTGEELSSALQLLGTTVNTGIGGENGSISFLAIRDKFGPVLDILADMLLHPAFPADALERQRARALVTIQQDRDRTTTIAGLVSSKVLYTAAHPYGRTRSEASVKAVTRDDILAFHRAMFQPGRAVIVVVGDITPAEARRQVERALGGWTGASTPASFAYPTPPAAKATTIYLVDKPGAAQSSILIGQVGPARSTPDYYALRVLNSFFGELFQSRLNANIREDKGWSYGVSSRFSYGRGPGPFRAGADVKTAVTDSALREFMKEIRGIRGDRAITDDEITSAKSAIIQSLPARLSSVAGVSGLIGELFTNGLPETYYQQFSAEINKVTRDDVLRVARQYIDPDHLAIVIVGDRKTIEAPLRALGLAPIVLLDADGNPL